MANIQINSIGSGCDYATIEEWWYREGPWLDVPRADIRTNVSHSGNLVAKDLIKIGELAPFQTHQLNGAVANYWYNRTTIGLDRFDDSTYTGTDPLASLVEPTSQDHFFVLRAKPGYEFDGNFNKSGVPIVQDILSNSVYPLLRSFAPYTRYEGFILRGNSQYDGTVFDCASYPNTFSFAPEQPFQDATNINPYAGRIGIVAENGCIIDSVGVQHIWNSGVVQNGYYRSIGILSHNGSTVRNCVVGDIVASAQKLIDIYAEPVKVEAIGIAYGENSNLDNNTIGNITAYRFGYDNVTYPAYPEILRAAAYYTPFAPTYSVSNSSVLPGTVAPECSGLVGTICQDGSTTAYDGSTYSDGTYSNMSCNIRLTITGYNSPCASLNGVYILAWNAGDQLWESSFTGTIVGSPTVSGWVHLGVTSWTDASDPGTWSRGNTTLVQINTEDGHLISLVGPELTLPINCRNMLYTVTDRSSLTAAPCIPGHWSATGVLESIPPAVVSPGSTVITNTSGSFHSYLFNNVGYNTNYYRQDWNTPAYSGGNYQDVNYNFYPSGHLVGSNNASQDRTSGAITGVIPSISFVNQYTNPRLLSTAWQLINSGVALNNRFLWDIEGQIRGGVWDIGADEYGSGLDTNIPEYAPLCIYGSQTKSTGLNLWMNGAFPSSFMPLWIGTYASPVGQDNTPLISGRYPINPFPLFTIGSPPGTGALYSSVNLSLAQGISGTLSTPQFPFYMYGYDKNPSGSIPLWIGTYYEEVDLLQPIYPTLRPGATGNPNSLGLFVEGSYTGGHFVAGTIPLTLGGISGITTNNIPLVLPSVLPRTTINTFGNPGLSGFPLYIMGSTPTTPVVTGVVPPNHPGAIPLFIYGAYATQNGAIPLYVVCSGTSQSMTLYTQSGGNNPDPYFIGTDGAQGSFTTIPLFINRPSNNDARWLSLYLQTLEGSSSGIMPLSVTGANGTTGNMNMYINSSIINNILRLFSSGW